MCLTPVTLKNAYRPIESRYIQAARIVPCGYCPLCLKRRSESWAFRLLNETKNSTSACFITLTYEDTPLSRNGLPTLDKTDYQKFVKRLRKKIQYDNTVKPTKIKYYACGEYGSETQRPHYHAIMFNLPISYVNNADNLLNAWGHGHVQIAPCNIKTIRYTTGYVMKGGKDDLSIVDTNTGEITFDDDRAKQFSLMSKNMGLAYLTPQMVKHHVDLQISFATTHGGTLISLPRYYRDKIFSKEEKKLLSIEAENIRNFNFKKLFNDDYKKEHTWKKDQFRKATKKLRLERQKI